MSFDELPLADLKDAGPLAGKRLAVLPNAPRLSAAQAAALDAFVQAGGMLLATGGTAQGPGSAPLACLGGASAKARRDLRSSMLEIAPEEAALFPHCADTPWLDLGADLWRVQPAPGAQTYLRLIPESPFGPPEECWIGEGREDVPGLLRASYGAGQSLWLPWRGAALCETMGAENPLRFLQDVLFGMCGAESVVSGLSPMVEVTLVARPGATVVQLVNASGSFGAAWRDPLPVRDITLTLPGVAAASAQTLCGGRAACQAGAKGLTVTLDRLDEYEAIVLAQTP